MNNWLKYFLLICLSIPVTISCKQSDPPEPVITGDFYFSGYYWNIKNSGNILVGPGPNRFSNNAENISLDSAQRLHLKIRKDGNNWYCSEVISADRFGYGTYVFTTDGDLTTLNEKTVFGLFTWNDASFQTQANSEVDIEFARWNAAADSLLITYSVQPVWFENAAPYIERTKKPAMAVNKLKSSCTHVFKWTPELITWESYPGDLYPGSELLCSWSFNTSNPPRSKIEGGKTSAPIIIPAPEDSTHVRFNLWLLNGQAPSDGQGEEVIIKSFKYYPLSN
jgi:hypothetical protein